ncbi:MAG: uncharacterized membrane protein YsdA (DUF1294 family)/cold shock CspA family protein [Paraglaciecola sp.]
MRTKGKIISWNNEQAYGFIAPINSKTVNNRASGTHVFIHKSAFLNKARTPSIDDVVTFTLSKDKQSRPCAIDATFNGEKLVIKNNNLRERLPIYFAGVFILGLVLGYLQFLLPTWIFILYVSSSVISVVMYIIDKSKAKEGGQRIPEITLHFLAMIGGWPGAIIAQQSLKHKNRKKSFRLAFWLTVLFNVAFFVWFVT